MIGNLKHRITLLKEVITINEAGFQLTEYMPYKTLWADAKYLTGKEYYAAATVHQEDTIKFIIRSGTQVETDMQVLFQEKRYNILTIDTLKYKGRCVEIKAKEVVSDGEDGT